MKLVDKSGNKIHMDSDSLDEIHSILDKHFDNEVKKLSHQDRLNLVNTAKVVPEEDRLSFNKLWAEKYSPKNDISPREVENLIVRELAVQNNARDNGSSGFTRTLGEAKTPLDNSLLPGIPNENALAYAKGDRSALSQEQIDTLIAWNNSKSIIVQRNEKAEITKQFEEIKQSLLGENEYINRRAQLSGINTLQVKQRGAADWDIHDPTTSLKTWLIQHIRGTNMPPIAPSVIFRTEENQDIISVKNICELDLKKHPFLDYTLAYDLVKKYKDRQYEFIRVLRLRGEITMCIFSINVYGDWEYKYSVLLKHFHLVDCIPCVRPADIIPGDKFYEEQRNTISTMSALMELAKDAQIQYMRLARFLRDFEEYDPEVVIKKGTVESVKYHNRHIQESYIEYTLDKSKTKRVKLMEAEERERAKWVKGEPKTREFERIGHKRHLADGRVINVRGTTVNPDSPLGKIVKDYKM